MLQRTALMALVCSLCLVPLAWAQEVTFDPGVKAPEVPKDYYVGAEKVVFHLSSAMDEKGYLTVLGNVANYIAALEATQLKTEAIVVMNADGLGLLRMAKDQEMEADAKLPARIDSLKKQGVKFQICYRTLTARKLPFDTLYGAVPEDVVSSGVAEVGRLQAQGYRLVKP